MAPITPALASGVRARGLQRGQRAPELDLPATPDGRRIRLTEHRDSPVILVFYPGDFTPVSTSELRLFNELLPELRGFGAKVFAISCDSIWAHLAYARELRLQLPLLADFHPKGEASRRYQLYRDDVGTCERALVAIDGKGVVLWSEVTLPEVNPGADGVIGALERMTGKSLHLS